MTSAVSTYGKKINLGGNIKSSNLTTIGLMFHIDAGNPNSYPGTPNGSPSRNSAIWYDISGNGNHFFLYNTPTHDPTTYSFNFNGIDEFAYEGTGFAYSVRKDYIFDTYNNLNQYACYTDPSSSRTIEIWFRSNGTSTGAVPYDWGGLFGQLANSNGLLYLDPGNKIRWRWDDSTPVWTQKQIVAGEWIQLVVCLSNPYYISYYVNGKLDTPQFQSSDLGSPGNLVWFLAKESRFNFHMACNISIVRMYNRVLTSQEILNNYNTNKSRFGLR